MSFMSCQVKMYYSTFQNILVLEIKFSDFILLLIQFLELPDPKDSDSSGLQVLMQMLILWW